MQLDSENLKQLIEEVLREDLNQIISKIREMLNDDLSAEDMNWIRNQTANYPLVRDYVKEHIDKAMSSNADRKLWYEMLLANPYFDQHANLRHKRNELDENFLEEEPAKGKKYSKTVTNPKTGRKKKVSYGAKGYTISPGTSRGDSYCARSYGIKKDLPKDKQNDPNTPNNLSRKKWKCKGKKSMKEAEDTCSRSEPDYKPS